MRVSRFDAYTARNCHVRRDDLKQRVEHEKEEGRKEEGNIIKSAEEKELNCVRRRQRRWRSGGYWKTRKGEEEEERRRKRRR